MARLRFNSAIILVFITLVACADGKVVFKAPAGCHHNFVHNAPRSKTTVKSRMGCEELCGKFDNCKSYQVSSPRKKCQLLKKQAGEMAVKMIPRKGWTYREKISEEVPQSCAKFPYATCSPVIHSFGEHFVINRYSTYGTFMRESLLPDGSYYWYENNNQQNLYRWTDIDALIENSRDTISLPFGADGGQAIVRDNKLWTREYNNRQVVVYDLITKEIIGRVSFESGVRSDNAGRATYAGQRDQCQYDWGGYSDIDVTNDHGAVWIIWGRQNYECHLAASRVDTETYEVEETHYLNIDKRQFGASFMVCGRLYFTHHAHGSPTGYFQLIWDLRTGNYTHIPHDYMTYPGYLRFPNRYDYNSYLDYNPADGRLYKWENSRMISYKPRFSPRPDDFLIDDGIAYDGPSGLMDNDQDEMISLG